jgi:hypothetical protein
MFQIMSSCKPRYQLCTSLWNIFLVIEINEKKQKTKFNVWGRRLGDADGDRRPPNTARTKHVLQTLNPVPFGDGLEDATGDALSRVGSGA